MESIISTLKYNWITGDEGKVLVVMFLVLVLGSFVGLFGFLMPFLISAKSSLLVIFGVISPIIYAGLVVNFYRIFFSVLKSKVDV